jgi:hypothetical protein
MVEIKEMDLENNEITYEDYSKISFGKFQDAFMAYWNKRIAGETISPFYVERFMKRSSSKNVSQLLHGKKAEGFLEATTGKKMDPGMLKIIIIAVIVGAGALIAVVVIKQLGLI